MIKNSFKLHDDHSVRMKRGAELDAGIIIPRLLQAQRIKGIAFLTILSLAMGLRSSANISNRTLPTPSPMSPMPQRLSAPDSQGTHMYFSIAIKRTCLM